MEPTRSMLGVSMQEAINPDSAELDVLRQHMDDSLARTVLEQLRLASLERAHLKEAVKAPTRSLSRAHGLELAAELDNNEQIRLAAWVIDHALKGVGVDHYPRDCEREHLRDVQALHALQWVLGFLLLLSIFEPPAWCGDDCRSESRLSGMPLLPRWAGHALNVPLLLIVIWHLYCSAIMNWRWRAVGVDPPSALNRSRVLPFLILAVLGLAESVSTLVQEAIETGGGPAPNAFLDAFQPALRVMLLFRLPAVRMNVVSMGGIFAAVGPVLIFYLGALVAFAWLARILFDPWKHISPPPNEGFETMGASILTLFSLSTTASIPAGMIPAYRYSGVSAALFVPFLFISQIVLLQVILATVFNRYSEIMTSARESFQKWQQHNTVLSFALLARGEPPRILKDRFVSMVNVFNKHHAHLQPEFADVMFAAADDDNTGGINEEEFGDVLDLLQYDFWTTKADSIFVRMRPGLADSRVFHRLKHFVEGGGLELVINCVLAVNAAIILMESGYDLRDQDTPAAFQAIDIAFSVIYSLDVLAHMVVMSFGTYWSDAGRRFDLISTILILGAQIVGFSGDLINDKSQIYINLLRTIRLFRLLRMLRLPQIQRIASTILNMLRGSLDVILFFIVVIYFWGAVAVACFGGRMKEGKDDGLDLFNFDDLPNAVFTLTLFLLKVWWDELFAACLSSFDTVGAKIGTTIFFVAFYICGVLVAFNIFVPFAISAFTASSEGHVALDVGNEAQSEAMSAKRAEFRRQGLLIHIYPGSALVRRRIMHELFKVDGSEDATVSCRQTVVERIAAGASTQIAGASTPGPPAAPLLDPSGERP